MTTIFFTLLCGIIFPISGCLLQRSWDNMLGDVYSVGLGSASCFGGALAACCGFSIYLGSLTACILSSLFTLLISRFTDTRRFLTFGMIYGSVIGALGTIVATNSDPEALQSYYRWASSSYFDIEPFTLIPALVALCSIPLCFQGNKYLTYLSVSLMVSTLLPAVGFVGMISLVAPNIAKLLVKDSFKKTLILSSVLGVSLLALTNLLVWLNPFNFYLPASATMAIISAPLLLITMKR